MKTKKFSILTAHFGARFWIDAFLSRLDKFGKEEIAEIIIIDQNRGNGPLDFVSNYPLRTVSFQRNTRAIRVLGHDHPTSLQHAISTLAFEGQNLVVMDSDCLPLHPNWLDLLGEFPGAALAGDSSKWGLTHPCLMKIPTASLKFVDFAEGLFTTGIDTGRLVGHQLSRSGVNTEIIRPRRKFLVRGEYYLQNTVYHFGSGSFRSSVNSSLARQKPFGQRFFELLIASGNFPPK